MSSADENLIQDISPEPASHNKCTLCKCKQLGFWWDAK